MEHFFSRVDTLLSKNNLSQSGLCRAIGITPQSYTNFKARNTFPLESAVKVAGYLNTSVEFLVSGKEPVNSQGKVEQIKAILSGVESSKVEDKDYWICVKQLCKERRLSQKDLSVALGWNPRTIETKIRNKVQPTISELIAIANYFECSIYSLIENSNSMQDSAFYKNQLEAIEKIIYT